jgi:hypothetical protein
MPVHDWTRVDAGLFHAFHQRWISSLCDALNGGVLPLKYFALPEQDVRGPIPGAFELSPESHEESTTYAARADVITVQHRHRDVVAVIEIVSPGNKASRAELRAFVQKSADFIHHGVHLLVIDFFPPNRWDPQGIHKAIWDEAEMGFADEEFKLPVDKRLTVVSYDAGPPRDAYLEPIGVGQSLLDMPLFLQPDVYVPTPLEATYQTTWSVFPKALKGLLE